ncbi:MAG: right-handed parallel beta-helix repeat-containing protein [Microbacteriaceae bacterium]
MVVLTSAQRPLLAKAGVCFTTIQNAIDSAYPGDVIEVPAGVYHETVSFVRSGEPGRPITLRAAPGARVLLDGADPELQAPNSRWTLHAPATSAAPAVYRAQVPFAGAEPDYSIGTWVSLTDTDGRHGCDRLLAAYASVEALQESRARGQGTYRDGQDVYVSLDDDLDPNGLGLNVGVAQSVIDLAGYSHIRVQGLEIRNGGWAGIYLPGPGELEPDEPVSDEGTVIHEDVQIVDVTVRNCFRQIAVGGASHLSIHRARLLCGTDPDWDWTGSYVVGVGAHASKADALSPWRGFGIQLTRVSDGEISDCLVAGHWDGMGLKRCTRVDVHHNSVHDIMDDAVELESPEQSHVRYHSNHLWDVFQGISVTVDYPGPIHVFRNVVESTHPRRPGSTSSHSIKSGLDSGIGRAENIKFYNNTFVAADSYNLWEKLDDPAPNRWHGYDFVNNVFWSGTTVEGRGNYNFRGRGAEDAADDNYWDSNVYNLSTPIAQAPLAWSENELTEVNAPWPAHVSTAPDGIVSLGTFAVPANGGAVAGTEYAFTSSALAEFVEAARIAGLETMTVILRETTSQPGTVSFVSKEDGDLSATSLQIQTESGSVTLPEPAADTYVYRLKASDDLGDETRVHVRGTDNSDSRRSAYVRFDLPELDAAVVDAAVTFRLGFIGAGRTESTIEVYALAVDFVPSPAEPGALTMADLADSFVTFTTPTRETPRDLRLIAGSVLVGSGSQYPQEVEWPDDLDLTGLEPDRGAWQSGLASQRIGAPADVLDAASR